MTFGFANHIFYKLHHAILSSTALKERHDSPYCCMNCKRTSLYGLVQRLGYGPDGKGSNPSTRKGCFLSFSRPISLYLTTVDLEGYCCMWSYTMTLTLGRTPLDEWSARCRGLCLQRRATLTRHRYRHRLPLPLVLISVRSWVDPRITMRPERLNQRNI